MIPSLTPSELPTAMVRAVYEQSRSGRLEAWSSDPSVAEAGAVLAEAGLGHVSSVGDRHCLTTIGLHPAFTVARSGGRRQPWRCYVELLLPAPRGPLLLACLDGAQLTARAHLQDLPWDTWTVTVYDDSATDAEHDPVHLADFEIAALSVRSISGATSVYAGFLTSARAWPNDVDPFSLEDFGACSAISCPAPHPFGPYLAPERDDLCAVVGQPVLVSVSPQSATDDRGRLLPLDEDEGPTQGAGEHC